jgi:hypothetical protein
MHLTVYMMSLKKKNGVYDITIFKFLKDITTLTLYTSSALNYNRKINTISFKWNKENLCPWLSFTTDKHSRLRENAN